MRNVAWTLATLTVLILVAATAQADPWGPPGYHHRPYYPYPAWRGPVVVHRPAYVVAPAPAYVPAPPPPVVVAPAPVVYPPVYAPGWYRPGVGIQYRGRDFGLSIGF